MRSLGDRNPSAGIAVVVALALCTVTFYALFFRHPSEASPWGRPAVVDGTTVHLTATGGACDRKRWVDVRETDSAVILTFRTEEDGGACTAVGIGVRIDAHLSRPLGGRMVIDGACFDKVEHLRGNCPTPVKRGHCGTADYEGQVLAAVGGDARFEVRLSNAVPGSRWRFAWKSGAYDDRRTDVTTRTVGSDGGLTVTHDAGNLARDTHEAYAVDLVPESGESCRVNARTPIFYVS